MKTEQLQQIKQYLVQQYKVLQDLINIELQLAAEPEEKVDATEDVKSETVTDK